MLTKTQNTETAQYIADELIYDSKHPKFANKVFLLVEDVSDKRVFYKLFNNNLVEIRPITGCSKFDDIIIKLKAQHIKHFAIKDADFNRVFNINPTFDNLFYTDCHDIEMMCFYNEDSITEIFANYSKKYDNAFIISIFKDLELLSKFKCLNIYKTCHYCFKGYKVVDKDNVNNDLSNFTILEKTIKERSHHITDSVSLDEINSFFSNCRIPNLEFEITNGHDFMALFCCYFRKDKEIGIHDFCEKQHLRPTMGACFRMEHFVKTQLYKDISAWAASHSLGNIFA